MKNLVLLAAFIASTTSAQAVTAFDCHPETGGGDEIISLRIDSLKRAEMFVYNASLISNKKDVCGKGLVKGKLVEYGEAKLKIACKGGAVELSQEYDEMVLKISKLQLPGLSDDTYMCVEI